MAKTRKMSRKANRKASKSRRRNMRKTRTRRFVGGSQEMQKYVSPLVVNQVRY